MRRLLGIVGMMAAGTGCVAGTALPEAPVEVLPSPEPERRLAETPAPVPQPENSVPDPQPAPSPAPEPGPRTEPAIREGEVFTLLQLQSGDVACYVTLRRADGTEMIIPGSFDLCPGGSQVASALVNTLVVPEIRKGKVMAASCEGRMGCTEVDTVDLVEALKAP